MQLVVLALMFIVVEMQLVGAMASHLRLSPSRQLISCITNKTTVLIELALMFIVVEMQLVGTSCPLPPK